VKILGKHFQTISFLQLVLPWILLQFAYYENELSFLLLEYEHNMYSCMHTLVFSFEYRERSASHTARDFYISPSSAYILSFHFLYFHPFTLLYNTLRGSKCSVFSRFKRCMFVLGSLFTTKRQRGTRASNLMCERKECVSVCVCERNN